MKTKFFFFLTMLLMSSLGAFAHDIEAQNADGITIYYVWTNNKTELSVSFRGSEYDSYSDEYSGKVVIPESVKIDGSTYNVTSIGKGAFGWCVSLKSIDLPSSLKTIGDGAFLHTALECITLPEGITTIGEGAFDGCENLTEVKVLNPVPVALTKAETFSNRDNATLYVPLGSKAAYGAADVWKDFGQIREIFTAPIQLKDGTINARFSIIDYNAKTAETFGTYNLGPAIDKTTEGSIAIPEEVNGYKVVRIGDWSFRDCNNITSVSLPATITDIGESAFRTCSQLDGINIPEGVTHIGSNAFKGCLFASVTLPSTLLTIDELAFDHCDQLTSVTMNGVTPPTIGEYTFSNRANVTLYVPLGSKAAYGAADVWKDFKEILGTGDLSGNGSLGPEDVSVLIGLIMSGTYKAKADLNGDNKVNAVDLVILTNIINQK